MRRPLRPADLSLRLASDGIWGYVLRPRTAGRLVPALFLDRDGVIVDEVHYLHRCEDVRLLPGAAAAIAAANDRAVPVVVQEVGLIPGGELEMSDHSRLERIFVSTDYPVAVNSPDHLQPWGTAHDNSRNATFNAKLYRLFAHLKRPLRVLDLGCSGGGFVRDCIDDGCIAVGLEGSDYSQRMSRAEWAVLGGRFLLTSDITKDFRVTAVWDGREEPVEFDVVTAWDVLEHIAKEDLPKVCENIRGHLMPSGVAIMSISPKEEVILGARLHQTVENKEWWVDMFSRHALFHCPEYEAYFNGQYVRGPKYAAPGSFHVILSKDPGKRPQAPSLSLRRRLLDFWLGSKGYWLARRMVGVS